MNLKNTTNTNQGKRWGNSRLASRSPSIPHSSGGGRLSNRCRNCLGFHPTEACDITNAPNSGSPLRSLTPSNSRRGIQGVNSPKSYNGSYNRPHSKAYSRACKYYALGKCVKGANCTFLHNDMIPSKPGLHNVKSAPVGLRNENMASHFTYNPTPKPNAGPKRIPAPLNLQEDGENESNLRPVSPQNIARSRPTSRATGGPNARLRHPHLAEKNLAEKLAQLKGTFSEDGYSRSRKADPLEPMLAGVDEGAQMDRMLPVVYTPQANGRTSPRFDFPKTGRVISASVGASPRRMKDPNMDKRSGSVTPSKAFTRPCKYYAQGFCVKGSACTFLHSHQDSVALSDRLSAQSGVSKTEKAVDPSKMFVRLCRYYIKNQCVKGQNCTFIHPTPEQLRAIKIKSVSPNSGPMLTPSKSVPVVRLADMQDLRSLKSMNAIPKVLEFRPAAFRPTQRTQVRQRSSSPKNTATPQAHEFHPAAFRPSPRQIRQRSSSPNNTALPTVPIEFRPAVFRPSPRTQVRQRSTSPMNTALPNVPIEFRPAVFRTSPRTQVRQRSTSPMNTEIQKEPVNFPSASQSPRTCVNKAVAPPIPTEANESMTLGDNGSLVCTNINQSKAKTKPCKFYALGQCLKGDRCTFIHEERVPEKPPVVESTPLLPLPVEILPVNTRVSSPRFARVENRAYSFNELDDIEDYVAGLNAAQKQTVANSNVAAVVLTFDSEMQEEINNTLSEIHNTIKQLNKDSEENDYGVFLECYNLGCTHLEPEQIADDIRRSDMDFRGRREALCQPRFGHILRALRRKGVIPENSAYLYQIEAVNEKYAFKYPYANISMVFQKGDKGERIEQVAIRGLFEKQHVILDRKLWDKAFKARAPPIYLPYFLTGEQLAKYPESRRVWFCGAHSLFVPTLNDVEFIKLETGEDWPSGADVPSRYAANPVPAPTLFITSRSMKKVAKEEPLPTASSDSVVVPLATVHETDV